MKKFLKPLIVATSVAAVIGVGAVSFAKWEGSGSNTVSSSGNIGSVTLVGFGGATATAWTDSVVPYDQPADTIISGGKKVVSITLPALTAVEGQTVTVKATQDGFSTTESKYSKLYVVAQKEGGAPAETAIVSGAKEATASSGAEVLTVGSGGENASVYTLYFALDSNDTAAMTHSFNITIELSTLS